MQLFTRAALPAALLVFLAATVVAQESATDQKSAETKTATKKVKTVKVVVDTGLTLNVPTTWKKKPNTSRLRKGTFEIPAIAGEDEPGELTIFNFPGNQVDANFTRWLKQFAPAERKAKMTKGKAEDHDYYLINISGTYNKPIGPPIAGRSKPTPNSRMLGVIIPVPGKGMYFLKMAGPDKTIAAQANHLRKSFGGNKKTEKPYEF